MINRNILIVAVVVLSSACQAPFASALRRGDAAAVANFLDQGQSVDAPIDNGGKSQTYPLILATMPENTAVLKLLLKRGANPNVADPAYGITPLINAAWIGNLSAVKVLVEAGANPAQSDGEGKTALDSARESGRQDVIRYLESFRATKVADPASGAVVTAPSIAAPAAKAVLAPDFQQPEQSADYGVVIGVENYADLPAAVYAERDAAAVRSFFRALGIPERNIITLTGSRATKTGIEKTLEAWLPNNVSENSRVFVFYSGHGAPDPRTGDAYLLPSDGDPQYLAQTGYPLKRLYSKLGQLKCKKVLVALDSCFSGAGGRSVLAKGTRPLVGKVDLGAQPEGNITVFSASAGDQISGSDDEAGYGLFTYNFLQGLNGSAKDAQGRVTIRSLYDYVRPKVADQARRSNREQTPQLRSGPENMLLR